MITQTNQTTSYGSKASNQTVYAQKVGINLPFPSADVGSKGVYDSNIPGKGSLSGYSLPVNIEQAKEVGLAIKVQHSRGERSSPAYQSNWIKRLLTQ